MSPRLLALSLLVTLARGAHSGVDMFHCLQQHSQNAALWVRVISVVSGTGLTHLDSCTTIRVVNKTSSSSFGPARRCMLHTKYFSMAEQKKFI